MISESWVLVNGSEMIESPVNTVALEIDKVVPYLNAITYRPYEQLFVYFGACEKGNIVIYSNILQRIK